MTHFLVDEAWTFGSFRRESLGGTVLQKKLHDRGVFLSKSGSRLVLRDEAADALLARNKVTRAAWETYHSLAAKALSEDGVMTTGTNENILRRLHRCRLEAFGREVFGARWHQPPGEPVALAGIDQRAFAAPALARDTVLFYLSDAALLPNFLRDVQNALSAGKTVFCLCSDGADGILPGQAELAPWLGDAPVTYLPVAGTLGCMDLSAVPQNPAAAKAVAEDRAVLLGYGEDALLCCRCLNLPALVTVTPAGIPARAVSGLFTQPKTSAVYIPAHFDILPTVPLVERTRLSYYQLAILADRFGEAAYRTSWETLAKQAPDVFLNPYDDHLPPRLNSGFSWDEGSFDAAREAFFAEKLQDLDGVQVLHRCLSLTDFTPVPVDWSSREKREQVLVDGVLAEPGTSVRAIACEGGSTSPRTAFFQETEPELALLSNFTFFFTEKLLTYYNNRLQDRPREQIRFPVGSIDYYCYTDDAGRCHETLPLYGKSVLAAFPTGFAAFPWRLGGGSLTLGDLTVSWTAQQVNAPHPQCSVFTPLLSEKDEDCDEGDYLLLVGEDRLNVAVVNEQIVCIRRGAVSLPCIGVVFSLAGDLAEQVLSRLGEPDEGGYFDPAPLTPLTLHPDPPADFAPADWAQRSWAYGGGMGLISQGNAMTRESAAEQFRREGWTTPLSRQTQESQLHKLVRHPRTAVGTTEKGQLFLLVFSGRTPVSAGADYVEMCRAAQQMIPGIRTMINLDGGGSSVLGLLEKGVFTELSYPAPSDGSLTGMARPVNSMILVETKEKT